MPSENQQPSQRLIFALIMGGLLVWGSYVALGAYLWNNNPWRGVIVMISVGLFLGGWLLLLWNRNRRQRT